MPFELNIDKFLNTFWTHKVSDYITIESGSDTANVFAARRPHPVARIRCSALHSGCTADEAFEYAQAMTEAAFILKSIEAMYPQIEARWSFQEKKREMRRERRHVEPKPKRKMPVITEDRARALLAEIKRTNGKDGDGWRFANAKILLKNGQGQWRKVWRIDSYDKKLEVSTCGGWRSTDVSQRAFCEELSGRKLGNVRVIRHEYKTVDGDYTEREVPMAI